MLHGLAISPDLDTITYTLAGGDRPRAGLGAGRRDVAAMEALERYAAVRPSGSSAAPTWFNLGDRDLATHLYRTARLAEGAPLTEVTDEIRRAWGLGVRLLPMTDDAVATIVELAVGEDGVVPGVLRAAAPRRARARRALRPATAPSRRRPCSPRCATPTRRDRPVEPDRVDRADPRAARRRRLLAARRDSVVAVSPIVGGAALKGPADRMLTELGHEASVVGVARLYAPVAATLVIDPVDADLAAAVEAEGMRAVVAPSVMSSPEVGAELAGDLAPPPA